MSDRQEPSTVVGEGEASALRAIVARSSQDPVLRNSMAIIATTIMTSLLGYAFWFVVARTSGAEVSGAAAATTSALQATVLLASVGAAAAMIEWLPRSTSPLQWRQRVTAGLVVAVTTAAGGGVLVVGLLGYALHVLPQLGTPTGAGLFCLAAVFFAAGTLIDYVAVSERRSGVLLIRNLIHTGLRIPLFFIPMIALGGAGQILASWTMAAGASLVVAVISFRRKSLGRTLRPTFGRISGDLRQMASSLVGQHLITVAAVLAGYLLPILVVARLSSSDNAYFYLTWMLGSVFFMISPAVSTALFAEGATNRATVRSLIRRCLLISGGLLVIPMLTYLFGGGAMLTLLFGPEYAAHGRLLLVLMTLSAIPDALTNIAVAVLRGTGRLNQALRLNAAMLALCMVASWWLLPRLGIIAVGICWLASQTGGAVWVLASWRRICDAAVPAIAPESAQPSGSVAG